MLVLQVESTKSRAVMDDLEKSRKNTNLWALPRQSFSFFFNLSFRMFCKTTLSLMLFRVAIFQHVLP